MSKPERVIPNQCIGYKSKITKCSLPALKAVLYSLTIGFSESPTDREELNFTYELAENFKAFPTNATTIGDLDIFELLLGCPGLPSFNPMMLLHGEQGLKVVRPIETDRNYFVQAVLVDVQDKRKGALIVFKFYSFLEEKLRDLAFVCTMSIFIRGLGGFGKDSGRRWNEIHNAKQFNPQSQLEVNTQKNQALYYRLNSDLNPLHADPQMAKMGRFDRPILHGLCFYGMVARELVKNYLHYNVEQFKKYNARFVGHVYPGETLLIKSSITGNRINFVVSTKERGKFVMIGSL